MHTGTHQVIGAAPNDFAAIFKLLQSENLPVEDISGEVSNFFVTRDGDKIIAIVGLEIYGQDGLLRSMVVDPDYRNKSLAAVLLDNVQVYATEKYLKALYLITTTAEQYFSRKGFEIITRERVPSSIASSIEFSTLCPSTATVMIKRL